MKIETESGKETNLCKRGSWVQIFAKDKEIVPFVLCWWPP